VGSAELPWDDALLGDLEAALGPRPDRNRVQRLGEKLRAFLEEGLSKHQGWAAQESAILREVEAGRPVHILFRFDAAELYSLPWELVTLGSDGQYLGGLPGCLIQYEWPGARELSVRPTASPTPGRLLFGWSAAGGNVPAEQHLSALAHAASRGTFGFEPGQDMLPHLSLTALSRALREASQAGRPVTYLHLLCHGTLNVNGTTGLRWNASDPNTSSELVDAAALRQVLAPYKATLRLVVLSACHGGHPGAPGNVLGSVAQEIHRMGIAAVVASRMTLSVEGSVLLTESLYGALDGPDSIRPALLAAKNALAGTGGYDWASLQLYAQAEDAASAAPPRATPWKSVAALAALAAVLLALGLGVLKQREPGPVAVVPAPAQPSPAKPTPPGSKPEEPGPVVEEQTLAGQVFDEEDRPIAGAAITVSVGGDILKTQTDESGYFRLSARAERQLSVRFRVTKDGYEDYVNTATLGNTELGFALERSRR
jgi:hypothetical protein